MLEFENFELRIEPNPTGGYRALVLGSPVGEDFSRFSLEVCKDDQIVYSSVVYSYQIAGNSHAFATVPPINGSGKNTELTGL
jgi:hypothetical protein